MAMTIQIEVGSKVERKLSEFRRQYGEVIQVGEGSNEGRVRIQWSHGIYTPVKWDGKVSRRIRDIPTGEPERTISMIKSPRTWVKISALKVV